MKYRLNELLENLDTLWRIFWSILRDPDAGRIFILIDALDECERVSRLRFRACLKEMLTARGSNENINSKFLITCRPDLEIREFLCEIGRCLRIDSKMVPNDLAQFIDVKVDELCRIKEYPPKLKEDIKSSLTNKVGGTFLWTWLVLDDI
jgi:hypothetical protein